MWKNAGGSTEKFSVPKRPSLIRKVNKAVVTMTAKGMHKMITVEHIRCMRVHRFVYLLFDYYSQFRVFSFSFDRRVLIHACRYYEPLQLRIPTDDLVPGLSHEPSPAGSPVGDRLTIRSWELNSDVECAVGFEIPKKKTIA